MTAPTTYEHTDADGTPVVLESGVVPGVVYVQVGDPFAGPGALVPARDLLRFALAASGITSDDVEAVMDRDAFTCPNTQEHADAVWRLLTGEGQP